MELLGKCLVNIVESINCVNTVDTYKLRDQNMNKRKKLNKNIDEKRDE